MIPGGRRVRLLVAVVVAALGLLFVASMSGMLHTGFMQRTGVVSSPTDVKASNGQGATVTHRKPRIMYYNTHPGTQVNFEYIMSRLGLQFIRFNPTVIRDSNAMQAPRAKELIEGGFAASLCMGVDVIVISDTFPHARPLIASLIAEKEEHRCLDTHLVPELTNRFDWGVADAQETYYPMIWRVNWPGSKVNNLHWTENNPFESRNLADQTMATPEFRLLRPVGHTSVKPLALTRAETKLVAVFADGNEYSPLRYIMEALNIPHKVLPRHYGGPHTLAKYRAYIELPYQVSTMKLYENLAAGVVMLFPSPAFFQELVCKDYIWFLPTGEIFRTGDPNVGPDWTKYMDYFHTDLSDYFYYFDSWEHLKQILSADVVDTKNVKSNGPKFYETVRLKTLHGWAELLGSFGFEVLVDGEPKRSDVAIDAPYRNTLPASIKTAPNSVDDFQTQYNVLKQWKDDRGNSRMKLERQAKATMNALDLGALQFKKYYHEKPGKGLFLGFSSELNLVDETLVRLQDSLNGATEVPASNQDIDFLLKLSTKLSEYSYLSETGYRSFAQTARILQSLHAIAVNGENVRVALKGIPETTIKKLKDSFNSKLTSLVYPWFPKLSDLKKSMEFSESRGLVFMIQDDGFERIQLIMAHLRKNLNCKLPAQIFHNGNSLLSSANRESLSALTDVEVVNLQDLFGSSFSEYIDDTEHAKPFALLASKFKEVFYIHQDDVLFQDPDAILTASQKFQTDGVLLVEGASTADMGNSVWARWYLGGIEFFSATAQASRYMRNETRHEIHAGVMAFDKSRLPVYHGLLVACHLNRKKVRDSTIHMFLDTMHLNGDREQYWLGLETSRASYELIHNPVAVISASTKASCGPIAFRDEAGKLMFFSSKSWSWDDFLALDNVNMEPVGVRYWIDTVPYTACIVGEVKDQIVSAKWDDREKALLKSMHALKST